METTVSLKHVRRELSENLKIFLVGSRTFTEWRRRQDELECRLASPPPLPFAEERGGSE
ncbi:hypothetical protein ACFLQ0_02380 [Nitrospinota bacterium]